MTSVYSVTKHGPPEPLNVSGNGEDAAILCDSIRRYWKRQGFGNVKVHPHLYGKFKGQTLWGVRSNLVGGWPPVTEEQE